MKRRKQCAGDLFRWGEKILVGKKAQEQIFECGHSASNGNVKQVVTYIVHGNRKKSKVLVRIFLINSKMFGKGLEKTVKMYYDIMERFH